MIKTACKLCKFAKFDISGNYQTGCTFNRIEKFKEYDIEIETETNNNVTSFIINDLCNYCFNKDSYNSYKNSEEKFREITNFDTDFIVVDNNNENFNDTFNSLILAINRTIYQDIRPKTLFYVLNTNDKITAEQKYYLGDIGKDLLRGTGVEFYFTYIFEKKDSVLECAQTVLNNTHSKNYSIFEAGYNIPNNFMYKLNEEKNTNLRYFVFFEGIKGINGITISKSLSKTFGHFISYDYKKIKETIKKYFSSYKEDSIEFKRLYIKKDELFNG